MEINIVFDYRSQVIPYRKRLLRFITQRERKTVNITSLQYGVAARAFSIHNAYLPRDHFAHKALVHNNRNWLPIELFDTRRKPGEQISRELFNTNFKYNPERFDRELLTKARIVSTEYDKCVAAIEAWIPDAMVVGSLVYRAGREPIYGIESSNGSAAIENSERIEETWASSTLYFRADERDLAVKCAKVCGGDPDDVPEIRAEGGTPQADLEILTGCRLKNIISQVRHLIPEFPYTEVKSDWDFLAKISRLRPERLSRMILEHLDGLEAAQIELTPRQREQMKTALACARLIAANAASRYPTRTTEHPAPVTP